MTKEERAEKWFRHIPGSENISMEKKMEVCKRVALKIMIVFLVIFLLEFVSLLMIGDGAFLNWLSNLLNKINAGTRTYIVTALVGILSVSPFTIIPFMVIVPLKNQWIKAEVNKLMNENI